MNATAGTTTRIMFVDDSKVMLKTAAKILGGEFEVITAVDGDDAWDKLGRHPDIQVLFTDINMPGSDGYALLKNVRTADDPGLNAMPVILVTGADDDDTARQTALDRGATDFLNKKHLGSELLPRARAHAKYQRISRQLQEQSTLDPITGLANEHGFIDRLEQDVAHARRYQHPLALLRVEIDGLAQLYDRFGNQAIEPIVVHVASLIRSRIRKEDTAGHIGLGAFAVSAPGGQLAGMQAMAAWLRAEAAAVVLRIDRQEVSIVVDTVVVGNESKAWASARDALDASQVALVQARRQSQAQHEHADHQAQERAQREAQARTERERVERQSHEQAALEQARRDAEAHAEREREERQSQEQAAQEQARRDAEVHAERERAAHQAEADTAHPREALRTQRAHDAHRHLAVGPLSWARRALAFMRRQSERLRVAWNKWFKR